MPVVPLRLRPGVNIEATRLLNEGGVSASNLIRFFNGLLQKLGGWTRLSNTTLTGICRGLHPWLDLSSNQYIAAGTNERLELYLASDMSINDITPIAHTSSALATPFATTINSPTVTVTDAGYHPAIGDWIYIATTVNVGGLKLQGFYKVTALPSGTTYQFSAGSNATATVAAGGTTFSFTTTATSANVAVTLGTWTFAAGDTILVYVPTAVGGLTLAGSYTMTDATHFSAGSAASGNATVSENGGNVEILYILASSLDPADPYTFGNGAFGRGPFGFGQGPTNQFNLRQWSLDNWGQILIASPFGGAIYNWTPPIAYNNVATIVTVAPAYNTQVFVAMPQQQLVSAGSDGGGFLDPLLIKWSDVSDYSSSTAWTPLATNQAGSFRIPSGSRIIGAVQGQLQAYIWTDIEMWAMRYVQPPFVYSFTKIGNACGLLAQRAVAQLSGVLIWAGHEGIFIFDGQNVSPLPCDVWDFFYNNRDPAYDYAMTAGADSDFNEWFLYFSKYGDNGINSSYIKFNFVSRVWDYGSLIRTAWCDRSDVAAEVGTDSAGYLQEHEVSNDADGVAMDSWAETAWIKIADGTQYFSLDRLLPDFVFSAGGSLTLTVTFADYEGGNQRVYGPRTVNAATRYIIVRGRGRLMKIRVESNNIGTFWRLGQILMQGAAAGRR